jgi:CheY-like chemotaxis protein
LSNLSESIDQEKFERLVKDGLANLFDLTALQTHVLTRYLGQNLSSLPSRGEFLRDTLVKAIEQLRPNEDLSHHGAPEWRPYLILRWRYVDGIRLAEINERLSLSGRQFRREHGRAVQAVAALLWDQAFSDRTSDFDKTKKSPPAAEKPASGDADFTDEPITGELQSQTNLFSISKSPLDVFELVSGVAKTLQLRAQNEGVALDLLPCDHLPKVLADRVILRQILISLISYAMEMTMNETVTIGCEVQSGQLTIRIRVSDPAQLPTAEIESKLLDKARFWAQKIDAGVHWASGKESSGSLDLWISLPAANEPVLLAVDDHEIALRMYKRYTSQMDVRLVGLQDGSQVLETARELQPRIIFLDVMIPNIDGWEVLQSLRANPATSHIPVIICTAWEEPELALSLGAAGLLKKPFSQQEFLTLLARFDLT